MTVTMERNEKHRDNNKFFLWVYRSKGWSKRLNILEKVDCNFETKKKQKQGFLDKWKGAQMEGGKKWKWNEPFTGTHG